MPRENSFSDSDGRSLTPDLEEAVNTSPPASPDYATSIPFTRLTLRETRTRTSSRSRPAGIRPPVLDPKERFRNAVRKVIALHRGLNVLTRRGAGAEPGVDPRRAGADAQYGGIKQDCVIELADYSAVRSSFGRMTNNEFVDLLADPAASAREPWVKVRWINIGGMSWDVMKALSIKYDIHPLALEDVFHAKPRARSKTDYYAQHLFLRVLCHELQEDLDQDSVPIPGLLSSYPPIQFRIEKSYDEKTLASSLGGRIPWLKQLHAAVAADEQRRIQDAALQALKNDERVNVNVVPMFIFLFRDGTVITIHSTPNLKITEPITSRVRQFDTVLRTSADASLLVQSIIALVTDKALEVVTAYQAKIKKFERKILVRPTIDTVRNLHILSADLILHRRTMGPIKSVVYGLRRYDVDRAAALTETSVKGAKVAGFMSHRSLIYLADVHDQMEYVLSQLDVIAGIGENLVDYTFNMTSYQMNEVMRRLMLVTVIFLPLTLLTGYFGMNFDFMWTTKHNHSDVIYWVIALPVMAIILPLFLGPDIERLVHYVRKKVLTNKAVRSLDS
ncbi:Magnesium-like protein [Mycena sanguinolenta]|uniref:Magnesium-like protein n=1 Tax=Mycena sanguinolenta TaxID=230812 RepID=A0A8H6XRG2_9AGAR|nr:Magnesium-like protein [Mycena sanguinolenta]